MIESLMGFGAEAEPPTGWTRLPDFPLGTVHSHGAVVSGNDLYVLTGMVDGELQNQMVCYSFLTKTWKVVPMRGGPVATYGHSLYLTGASLQRWGGVASGDVFIKQGYSVTPNTIELSWAPRATATVATEGQVVIGFGGISLTVGGRSAAGPVKTVQHQQSNGVVKNIRDLDSAGVWLGDGGFYNRDAYVYPYNDNQLIIYRGADSPNATKVWEYKPAREFSHTANTFTNIGQHFYLFGNIHEVEGHTGFERYDTVTDSWKMIKDTIPLRYSHAAARYGNQLIIIGGVSEGAPTNEVWSFDTTTIK